MRNYISLGPVSLRVFRKGIASWGYERLRIGGLTLFTRQSNGSLGLAAYHPRTSSTWHWSIALGRRSPDAHRPWISREAPEWRRSQWHDYYRLPFGWQIIVSRQDFHRWPKPANAA